MKTNETKTTKAQKELEKIYQMMDETKPTARVESLLEEIAKRKLLIPTLRTQKHNQLDFHDVAVWCVRDALRAAYMAGQQHATRNKNQ